MYNLNREDYISDFSFKRECMKLTNYHSELSEYYKKECKIDCPIIKEIDYDNNCFNCDYYQDIIGLRCINCGLIKLSECYVTLTDDVIAIILSSRFRSKGILTLSKSIRRQLISNHAREYLTKPISRIILIPEYYLLEVYNTSAESIKYMNVVKFGREWYGYGEKEKIFGINEKITPSGKIKRLLEIYKEYNEYNNFKDIRLLDIKSVKEILKNRAKSLSIDNDFLVNMITINTFLNNINQLSLSAQISYLFMNAYSFGDVQKDYINNKTPFSDIRQLAEIVGKRLGYNTFTFTDNNHEVDTKYIVKDQLY